MNAVHVLEREPIDERVEKADFLGAAEAEHVGHVPLDQELRHELATGHAADDAPCSGFGRCPLEAARE